MALQITPLSPVIGAEVSGVDFSQTLDPATLDELKTAWFSHLVLFFRDQVLTFEQHKELGRHFGDLHIHPAAPKDAENPEILVVHGDDKVKFVAVFQQYGDKFSNMCSKIASTQQVANLKCIMLTTLLDYR